jgi:hypothetical protein
VAVFHNHLDGRYKQASQVWAALNPVLAGKKKLNSRATHNYAVRQTGCCVHDYAGHHCPTEFVFGFDLVDIFYQVAVAKYVCMGQYFLGVLQDYN